jgi:transcriptional regulator with XRE-family HTH domain
MSPRAGSSGARERSEVLRNFGRTVRALRVERGQTQQGFAEQAGLAWRYYGAIERGEHSVTYETLLKIAEALEMPVSQILRRAEL